MTYGGDFSGWCCGSCDVSLDLTAGYWSFNAEPVVSTYADDFYLTTATQSFTCSPDVPLFDGRGPGAVPEASTHRWYLTTVPGKLAPLAGIAEGGSRGAQLSTALPEGKCDVGSALAPPWELVVHRDEIERDFQYTFPQWPAGENAVREPHRVALFQTQTAFTPQGQADIVNAVVRYYQASGGPESGAAEGDMFTFNGEPTPESFVQVNAETMQIVATASGFLYRFGYEPDLFGNWIAIGSSDASMAYRYPELSRHNASVGLNYAITSTYDEAPGESEVTSPNRYTWGVNRVALRGGESSSARKNNDAGPGAAGSVDNRFNIVRPAYQDHSGAPWVLSYNHTTGQWATGLWYNAELANPGGDPEDPTNIGCLASSEVETVLVDGELSDDARNLCYQQIGDRTLAIWWDPDRTLLPTDDDSHPSALGYQRHSLWIYDSDRSTPLFRTLAVPVEVFPDGYNPPSDPCDPANEPDETVRQSDGREPYHRRNNSALIGSSIRGAASGKTPGIPTFITADGSGDVYVGSPQFVAKCGPVASASYQWQVVWAEHYPTEFVSVSTQCDPGGELEVFTPFGKLWDSSRLYFGRMNHREFAILPTESAIQVRGCEGTAHAATLDQEMVGTDGYAYVIKYYEHTEGNYASREQWITDWAIAPDGQTVVPMTEGQMFKPNMNTDPADRNAVLPYGPSDPSDYGDFSASIPDVTRDLAFVDFWTSPPPGDDGATYAVNPGSSSLARELWIGPRRYTNRPIFTHVAQGYTHGEDGDQYDMLFEYVYPTGSDFNSGSFEQADAIYTLGDETVAFRSTETQAGLRRVFSIVPELLYTELWRGVESPYTGMPRHQTLFMEARSAPATLDEGGGADIPGPGEPSNFVFVSEHHITNEDGGGDITGIPTVDESYYLVLVVAGGTGLNDATRDRLILGGWSLIGEKIEQGSDTEMTVYGRPAPPDYQSLDNKVPLHGDVIRDRLRIDFDHSRWATASLLLFRDELGGSAAFDKTNGAENSTTNPTLTPSYTTGFNLWIGAGDQADGNSQWNASEGGATVVDRRAGTGSNAFLYRVNFEAFSVDPPQPTGDRLWEINDTPAIDCLRTMSFGR